jgi:uncharacterized membrane protein
VEFIDLLRGWAVIVMIETHVVNATLLPSMMASAPFQVLKFIDGLVAPSFLFASGLAYAITTRRKVHDYLSFGPPLFKQLRRLLAVLLIGYSLHIPKFNYSQLVHDTGIRAWELFFQVDVLQCIAVSLLLLQTLLLLLRSERRLYATVIPITVGVVLMTPIAWAVNFVNFMPFPVAAYFNGLYDSFFPLFPWSAFLFSGSLAAYWYLEAKGKGVAAGCSENEVRMMKSATWAGAICIGLSFLMEPAAAALYPVYDYWRLSPSFFLLRLGLVVFLMSGMFWYEKRKGVTLSSPVALIGRESLLVYTAHIVLIYGNFGRFNFHDKVNNSFGILEVALTTAALLLLMYSLAYGWSRIRQGPLRAKRAIQWSFLAILLGVFFFGPGQ